MRHRPLPILTVLSTLIAAAMLLASPGCETTVKPKKTPIRGTATHSKVQTP